MHVVFCLLWWYHIIYTCTYKLLYLPMPRPTCSFWLVEYEWNCTPNSIRYTYSCEETIFHLSPFGNERNANQQLSNELTRAHTLRTHWGRMWNETIDYDESLRLVASCRAPNKPNSCHIPSESHKNPITLRVKLKTAIIFLLSYFVVDFVLTSFLLYVSWGNNPKIVNTATARMYVSPVHECARSGSVKELITESFLDVRNPYFQHGWDML